MRETAHIQALPTFRTCPATEADLEAAELAIGFPIPATLRALYRLHDGQRELEENPFFPLEFGSFAGLKVATDGRDLVSFIGPFWADDTSEEERSHWLSHPPRIHPEQVVPPSWIFLDEERSSEALLPEECSTAWLMFAWEGVFISVVHLRTGRVFRWTKGDGLSFVADSFEAFLMGLADDLWNGKHKIERDPYDDGPMEERGWVWDQ